MSIARQSLTLLLCFSNGDSADHAPHTRHRDDNDVLMTLFGSKKFVFLEIFIIVTIIIL